MSSSVGVCLPCSILLTFDGCHHNDSASSLPVSPACRRSSRRRWPGALRASSIPPELLDRCLKVIPSNGVMEGNISPVIMRDNLSGISNDFAALELVLLAEVHPHQLSRIEQPVVVVREVKMPGHITGQVADVFPCRTGEPGRPQPESAVVGQRYADDSHADEAPTFS